MRRALIIYPSYFSEEEEKSKCEYCKKELSRRHLSDTLRKIFCIILGKY